MYNQKMQIVVRRTNDDVLCHKGKKGMKWGYNDGKKNGKRTASEAIKDVLGYDEREARDKALNELRNTSDHAEINAYKNRLEEVSSKVASGEYFDKDKGNESIIKPYRDKYIYAKNTRLNAEDKALKAIQAYSKTPLGMLDRFKSEAGYFISSLLSKKH